MKKTYTVNTGNLIALCHILDDFDEFEESLEKVISPKYNRDFVFQLFNVSKGKKVFGARKAKKFYQENKEIIDIINQHTNIARFINDSYGYCGESNGDLDFFFQYFLIHIDEVDKILLLLEKIKELGFENFEFNKSCDFTKEGYGIEPDFRRNFMIMYVANAEVVPSYDSHIYFKTSDSSYKMELKIIGEDISQYGKELTVNNLVFDPNTLPDKIDKEHVLDPIVAAKNAQYKETRTIRNSVDLGIGVMDLENQLVSTKVLVQGLDGVENKDELLEVLDRIGSDVLKLKELSLEYDASVADSELELTGELLDKEKSTYIKRREWSKIDLC